MTQTQMNEMNTQPKKERSYDNEKRIVLFQNNMRKDQSKDPVMRGSFVLNGKTYYVSLWTELMSKDGKDECYMRGQIQDEEERTNAIKDASMFFDKDQARVRAEARKGK